VARRPETLGTFAADLVTSLGGKPTQEATKLFNSWQRWEGGWSANDATYNPLNLTAPGSGLPTINSVGVVAMPSYQEGVKRTADLIRKGYPSLAKAFSTGKYSFQDPGLQADLNRWLSGNRTPGMTPYVSKIASTLGQGGVTGPVVPSTVATEPAPPTLTPRGSSSPFLDPFTLSGSIRDQFIQGAGRVDLLGLPGTVRSSWKTPPPPPQLQTSPQASSLSQLTPQSVAPGPALPLPGVGGGGEPLKWVGKIEHRSGPSKPHTPAILQFVGQVGQTAGKVLTPWGNESHSLTTVNGNPSAHGAGNAADIPAAGDELTRLGQAALIAAGMPPAEARKQKGGLFNIGGKQVIFNTNQGGNHYDHLHVGLRG
jgi:hypothetical protein